MTVKRQTPKNVNRASWLFGHPVLRSAGVSQAYWAKSMISPSLQKGGGWHALLNGGVQTGANWAGIYIPVNDMTLSMLDEAQWSYHLASAQAYGVNIVVWAHDADNVVNRAEITQQGDNSLLGQASGWNSHEFNTGTTQMFYYGELDAAATIKTNLTAGTQYTWEQFKADPLFKDWVLYRISLENGWRGSGTFIKARVSEIKLNEVPIPLIPTRDDLESSIFQYATATSSAIAEALAPGTPFELISIHLNLSAAGTTSESFTVNLDAGRTATVYDTLLYTVNTLTGSSSGGTITDLFVPFGKSYTFMEDDEIDCAWANTEDRTYGLTYAFRVLP